MTNTFIFHSILSDSLLSSFPNSSFTLLSCLIIRNLIALLLSSALLWYPSSYLFYRRSPYVFLFSGVSSLIFSTLLLHFLNSLSTRASLKQTLTASSSESILHLHQSIFLLSTFPHCSTILTCTPFGTFLYIILLLSNFLILFMFFFACVQRTIYFYFLILIRPSTSSGQTDLLLFISMHSHLVIFL